MDIEKINKDIALFTASYDQLNSDWEHDPCDIDTLQVLRQTRYSQFYNHIKDFGFEEMILGVISLKIDPLALNNVREQLKSTIKIYQKYSRKFEGFNTYKLFKYSEQQLFDNKLEVLYRDKADIEGHEYSFEEEKQKLLKEVDDAISKLKKDQSGYAQSSEWVKKNYYKAIYIMTTRYLSILDSYFPVASKENNKTIKPHLTPQPRPLTKPLKEKTFISMRLASEIHELCNNNQFEPLSETDFYHLLNNLPAKAMLTIKPGEKNRVYFLIHRILETIPENDKKEWKNYIFHKLDIQEAQYKSKYREPISQLPSKKSKEFAGKLEKIFSNY